MGLQRESGGKVLRIYATLPTPGTRGRSRWEREGVEATNNREGQVSMFVEHWTAFLGDWWLITCQIKEGFVGSKINNGSWI
jgi:hypothetical protein